MALKFILLLSSTLLIFSLYTNSHISSTSIPDLTFYERSQYYNLESLTKSATQLHSSDNLKILVNLKTVKNSPRLDVDILLISTSLLFVLCALAEIKDRRKKRYDHELDCPLISKKCI